MASSKKFFSPNMTHARAGIWNEFPEQSGGAGSQLCPLLESLETKHYLPNQVCFERQTGLTKGHKKRLDLKKKKHSKSSGVLSSEASASGFEQTWKSMSHLCNKTSWAWHNCKIIDFSKTRSILRWSKGCLMYCHFARCELSLQRAGEFLGNTCYMPHTRHRSWLSLSGQSKTFMSQTYGAYGAPIWWWWNEGVLIWKALFVFVQEAAGKERRRRALHSMHCDLPKSC